MARPDEREAFMGFEDELDVARANEGKSDAEELSIMHIVALLREEVEEVIWEAVMANANEKTSRPEEDKEVTRKDLRREIADVRRVLTMLGVRVGVYAEEGVKK